MKMAMPDQKPGSRLLLRLLKKSKWILALGAIALHFAAVGALDAVRSLLSVPHGLGLALVPLYTALVASSILVLVRTWLQDFPLPFFLRVTIGGLGLHWLAFSLHSMWHHFSGHGWHLTWDWRDPLTAAIGSTLAFLGYRGHVKSGEDRIEAVTSGEARKVRGLILFLSTPAGINFGSRDNPPQLEGEAWTNYCKNMDALPGPFCGPALFASDFLNGVNWKMPLTAINHHLLDAALDRGLAGIAVITSADAPNKQGDRKGSTNTFPFFRKLVLRLWPENMSPPHIVEVAQGGVPFDNAADISLAVANAKRILAQANLVPSDYVIDVTGGTALCSVVGAALSFEGDKIFQYIPPTQTDVLEYDIRYVNAKSNEPE